MSKEGDILIEELIKEANAILKEFDKFKKEMLSDSNILFSSINKYETKKNQGGGANETSHTSLRQRRGRQQQQLLQQQRRELGLTNRNEAQEENERFREQLLEEVRTILEQVTSNAQVLGNVEQVVERIDETTEANQSKIKNMHKDLKKGFADLKSRFAKDSSCFGNPNVVLGILAATVSMYFQGGVISFDSFGPTSIGIGSAATFYKCVIVAIQYIVKLLIFIINMYIKINKGLHQIYNSFLSPIPYIGQILAFMGLVLQIAINVTIIKTIIFSFGCEILWERLQDTILPMVAKLIGKMVDYINQILEGSKGVADNLLDLLDSLTPEELLPEGSPKEVKGRFMIVFKSILFLPFRLIGYFICAQACATSSYGASFIGCDCSSVGGSLTPRKKPNIPKKTTSNVMTLFEPRNSFDSNLDKSLGKFAFVFLSNQPLSERMFIDNSMREDINEKLNKVMTACVDTADKYYESMVFIDRAVEMIEYKKQLSLRTIAPLNTPLNTQFRTMLSVGAGRKPKKHRKLNRRNSSKNRRKNGSKNRRKNRSKKLGKQKKL